MKSNRTRLQEVAKVIRSKNAGPFELTLDIIFSNPQIYQAFKQKSVLTTSRVAELFQVLESEVNDPIYFDLVCAVKITFKRAIPSGSFGDTDVYGAQQHAPLLNLEW